MSHLCQHLPLRIRRDTPATALHMRRAQHLGFCNVTVKRPCLCVRLRVSLCHALQRRLHCLQLACARCACSLAAVLLAFQARLATVLVHKKGFQDILDEGGESEHRTTTQHADGGCCSSALPAQLLPVMGVRQTVGAVLTARSALVVDEKFAMLKPRNCTPSRPGRSSGGTPTAGRLAALRSMGARSSRLPSCR